MAEAPTALRDQALSRWDLLRLCANPLDRRPGACEPAAHDAARALHYPDVRWLTSSADLRTPLLPRQEGFSLLQESNMSQDAVLAVSLRPGVRPLTSVISVLHVRAVDVATLTYSRRGGRARLTVRCSMTDGDADLLARQLARRIDVLSAAVQKRPASVGYTAEPSC
jgi:hypothetical protein